MSGSGRIEVDLVPKRGFLPAQAEACSLVEDPTGPKWVLLSGGQGAGKSHWEVWQLLRLHFINVNHVLAAGGSAESVWGMLLAPTYGLFKKSLGITLETVLAECGLGGRYTWNRSDGILRFEFGGGLYTFSAENPERIIAVTVSEAAIDEPGTPKKMDAVVRVAGRLRGPGLLRKVIMAGTPEDVVSRQEFYDFIASPEAQAKYGARGDNTRRVVFAPTRQNVFIENLAEYVTGQEQVLTKAQQAAYLEGQFVAFNVGRVYGAYIDRSVDNGGHRIPVDHDLMRPPGKGNPLLITLDFNVDPMCGLIAVPHGPNGQATRVLDEIRLPKQMLEEGETPISRWCDEAIERWVGRWHGAVHVFGDATAERQNVAASKSGWAIVHDKLRPVVEANGWDYVISVPGANPREIDRINTVNAAFERGEILVPESCPYLRRDLNLVGFKEGTTQIDKSDSAITHLSDALGYMVCSRAGVLSSRVVGVLPPVLAISIPSVGETYDWNGR